MAIHKDLASGNSHVAHNWEYANAGARTGASGFVTADLKKLALQTDNNTLWLLTATTPTWQAVAGVGDALTTNPLSQFAATTSAQLAGVMSDETGSGSLVFATSPTLVTPALGTPSSGNLASCTGYPGTSALVTTGALNSGSITSGFGSIDIGTDTLAAGNTTITGTLSASGNITSQVAGGGTATTLNLGFNSAATANALAGTIKFGTGYGNAPLIKGYMGVGSSYSSINLEVGGSAALILDNYNGHSLNGGLAVTGALSASGLTTISGSTDGNREQLKLNNTHASGRTSSIGFYNPGLGNPVTQITGGYTNTAGCGKFVVECTNDSGTNLKYIEIDGQTAARTLTLLCGGTSVASMRAAYSIALQGATPQTGIGITFPATQSASSDPNTLDDYEEGTWTPTRNGFTEVLGGGAINNTGEYVKVGRKVRLTAKLACTGGATLAATAAASYLTGLPFNCNTSFLVPGDWVNATTVTTSGQVAFGDATTLYIATGWSAASNVWVLTVEYAV